MEIDEITREIVDSAVKLHLALGPGLLESVYQTVLPARLAARGLQVETQVSIPFEFDGMLFEGGLRVDILVNDIVVVELKAVDKIAPVHTRQVLTYLRLLDLPVGLLLNFGAATMPQGTRRIVNRYEFPSSLLRINQK